MPRVGGGARHLSAVDDDVDNHVAPPNEPIARFAGYLIGHTANPRGEWSLRFGVERGQTGNIMGLFEHLGGTMFEIVVRKVPRAELPPPNPKWEGRSNAQ